MKKDDLTILVLSCDKYKDLWKPFFDLFYKHWKNCPYPVVLGSNTVSYQGVKTILSGPDNDWSSSLLRILSKVKTKYIFLWLDDIFPISDINEKYFIEALTFLKIKKGVHMHAYPTPKPDHIEDSFGLFDKGAPYRATALGFWETSYLAKLLIPGETPWEFEIMGSYRTSFSDGFYCVIKPLFKRLHIVEKRKIFRDANIYLRKHNILLLRNVNEGSTHIRSWLQSNYFNLIIRVPWRIRVKLMNWLRKILISY